MTALKKKRIERLVEKQARLKNFHGEDDPRGRFTVLPDDKSRNRARISGDIHGSFGRLVAQFKLYSRGHNEGTGGSYVIVATVWIPPLPLSTGDRSAPIYESTAASPFLARHCPLADRSRMLIDVTDSKWPGLGVWSTVEWRWWCAFNRPRLERGNGRNARMAIVFEYDTFSEVVGSSFSIFEIRV